MSTIEKTNDYIKIIEAAEDLDGSSIEVGIFGGKNKITKKSIAFYMMMSEIGTKEIPERSFMRSTIDENEIKYDELIEKQINRIVDWKQIASGLLITLALQIEGDVKNKITSLRIPPNAPSTIEQKGSSNPLIDTGAGRNAVTHKIDFKA